MSSRDLVNVVGRRLRSQPETKKVKVGHCGTLDPLAEGVLVIGVGTAVRLVPYVQQQAKRYHARFRLGQSSPTGDLELAVTHHDERPIPSLADLTEQAKRMIGEIEQTPPAYSAIWVDGQRAHERARRGEEVRMPSRKVMIHSMEIVDYRFPELELDVVCGSGTYIRTLGIDLARHVGTEGVMSYLQRVSIGPFDIADALTVDALCDRPWSSMLRPTRLAVMHLPHVVVDDAMATRIEHGLPLPGIGDLLASQSSTETNPATELAAMTEAGNLLAILRVKRGQWAAYRVFPRELHPWSRRAL